MKIFKRTEPTSRRLVGIATSNHGRFIELGDLMATVKMPWTSLMKTTPLEDLGGRRFIKEKALKAWANDLDSKSYKKTARQLNDFIAWATNVKL